MKKIFLTIGIILCVVLCLGVFLTAFNNKGVENSNNSVEYEQSVDYSKLVYTAVGDSITWGQDGVAGTRMARPYCDVVGRMLGLKKVYNLGIGWSTMTKLSSCDCHENFDVGHTPMCERYSNISVASDIISISAGVNDRGLNCPLGDINSYDKSTFYGAYNVMLRGVTTGYSSAWVFLLTPTCTRSSVNSSFVNDLGLSIYDYVNAVKELGKKWNLPVCELHNVQGIIDDVSQSGSDGVHPTQSCVSNVISPIITQFIKDNYKK